MILRYTLIVRHPETGEAVALLAGSEVPKWASSLVQPDDCEQPKSRRKTN